MYISYLCNIQNKIIIFFPAVVMYIYRHIAFSSSQIWKIPMFTAISSLSAKNSPVGQLQLLEAIE